MQTKINLLFEIIQKVIIMRSSHLIVKLLRNYASNHLENYSRGNVIHCYDLINFIITKEWSSYFCHTYKSYRRI